MDGKLAILFCVIACALPLTEADDADADRQPDCIEFANALHEYIALMVRRNRYFNVSEEIKWGTSLDLSNLTAIQRIACGIEGKPPTQVAKYFVDSGLARYIVRRGYGNGVALYRMYKQQLRSVIDEYTPGSVLAQLTELGLRTLNEVEDRGFFCLDSQSVAEALEKWRSRQFYEPNAGAPVSCDEFQETAQGLFDLMQTDYNFYIDIVSEVSGLQLADTANIGQFLCDIVESKSFDGIVNVLNSYGIFEHALVYGLQMIPQAFGPIEEYELAEHMTDEELVERYPWISNYSAEEIADLREEHRLSVNLHRELKTLGEGITNAQID